MKSNNKIFGIIIIFILGVSASLIYFLTQYYNEMQLTFAKNQFPFFIFLIASIFLIFIYTITNNILNKKQTSLNKKQISNLSLEVKDLKQIIQTQNNELKNIINTQNKELNSNIKTYHYSEMEATSNISDVILDIHNLLEDKVNNNEKLV